MEYVHVPNWLLVAEFVGAVVTLLLWFAWAWRAAVSALRHEFRNCPRVAWALGAATLVGLALRLSARPTILYGLGQASPHIRKIFHPFGANAHWHAHVGIGAYTFFYGLTLVAGRRLATIWTANALLGAACIPAFYLFIRRIADDRAAALCGAWLLAVFVPQIRVDASEQLFTLSLLAFLLAYVLWLDAYADDDKRSWHAAGVALAACLCFRPASVWQGAFALLLPAWLVIGRARLPVKGLLRGGLVCAALSAPRLIVGAAAVTQSGHTLLEGQVRFVWQVVTSGRDMFLNPRVSCPLYAVLAVIGLFILAYRRHFRLFTFMLFAITATAFLYYNEWTLDENDALRFQAVSWPWLVALSGIGAAAIGRRLADARARYATYSVIVAAAAAWLFVGRRLLWTPLATDRGIEFFASNLDKVPQRCTLLIQGRLKPGRAEVFDPSWVPQLSARRVRRYPEALDKDTTDCRVAYVGVNCYTYGATDAYSDAQLKAYYRRAQRGPLFTLIDRYQAAFDRAPPPLLRPECALLGERYRLQPIVETSIVDVRGGTRSWRPKRPLRIGFYYLRVRKPKGD